MMIYLEPEQKMALKRRADATGGSVSKEVRTAIDQYLNGATPAQIEALDALSRQAEQDLAAMEKDLGETVEMVRDAFSQIAEIRKGRAAS